MSPAGVFLRSIAALLLGVSAFTALGYAFVAMGVRDTLRSPQPLLNALEEHDAYNRVYDEGIISEQFEGELRGLVGDFSLELETEAWLLKEILPPSELKTATEQSVTSVIAFLSNETDTFDVSIDLGAAIPRIKPAVFRLIDERIDKAQLITVTGEEELQSSVEAIVRNIAAGTFPDTVPALDRHRHPPNWVINAFWQSTELLPDAEARQTAKANLARDVLDIVNALESGDTNAALKLAARAIADPVIDDSIDNLREDIDDRGQYSAVDKIAQSVGSRHETFERFRFARMVLRLLVGGLSITAIIVFVAAIGGIAGIFYSYPKHMARWPRLNAGRMRHHICCHRTFHFLVRRRVGIPMVSIRRGPVMQPRNRRGKRTPFRRRERDGPLVDCRDGGWHSRPCRRPVFAGPTLERSTATDRCHRSDQ